MMFDEKGQSGSVMPILLVRQRDELTGDLDLPTLARGLKRETTQASASWAPQIIDRVTRPGVFVFLGLEPTPTGRETFAAIPRWPELGAGG
jgi:hypothetical protein